ncbi:cytochrome b561 [Paraburkholderia sp. WSM4179]|nr:cytochrome b561 [Paraburkholderia sp. WSM4179]
MGTAQLAAMACRELWRATHRSPPDNLPPLFRAASKVTHLALCVLLVLVPLLGWINASSRT